MPLSHCHINPAEVEYARLVDKVLTSPGRPVRFLTVVEVGFKSGRVIEIAGKWRDTWEAIGALLGQKETRHQGHQ